MFPAGCMRVLAVDGDPTCLKVLENLLLRCDYHVTTTGRAATALKLLRENKDQFDLMISEIHLPDMDGFKLLELVGLEMDLPVIMMSANGETQTVMKGITHGACDYLLKLMRLEQLKTIWQHVVRRNTNNHGSDNDDAGQMGQNAVAPFGYFLFSAFCNLLYNTFRFAIRWLRASPNVEAVGLPSFSREKKKGQHDEGEEGGANCNKWQSLRDRDENGDDGDDSDENSNDNGDSSSQKKPRVVWSVELHRKFVAAVNQLGIDKAVPKKILDLMNVENITRENVATHLQKYRLYQKRLSMDASRQVNLIAALGGRDPAYSNMNSLDVLRHYNNAYGRYQPVPVNTHSQPNNLVARVNSPSSYGMRMLLSSQSQPLQLVGHAQNYLGTSLNDLGVSNGTLFPMEFNQDATAPFTFGSSTKSGEVLNSNLACSNSGINLHTENSVVPRQAPGGGNTSSAPSLLDGMVEQQTVGNQLNYNDDLVWTSRLQRELSGGSDDVVIDISRPDNGNHGVFSDGDW